jgi:hypothetical protein
MYKIIPAAYVFTHTYLRTIQVGIQSAHVAVEFFVQNENEPVYDWAVNHKTMKLLNAGGGEEFDIALTDTKAFAKKFKLPFAYFREPDNYNQIDAFGVIVTPEMAFEVFTAQENFIPDRQYVDNFGATKAVEKWVDPTQGHPLALHLSKFRAAT